MNIGTKPLGGERCGATRRTSAAHRLNGCRRGTASVEFALVAAPFLLLCFAFIAVNTAIYTRSMMQNQAQLAARMLATGQTRDLSSGPITPANLAASASCTPGMAASQAEYHVCNGLPTWATYAVTTTLDCTVPSVTVQVQAGNFTAAAGNYFNRLLGRIVTARVVMMKEGQCP